MVLDGLRESIALIARKSPAHAQAYRDVVLGAAQRALNDIRNALS